MEPLKQDQVEHILEQFKKSELCRYQDPLKGLLVSHVEKILNNCLKIVPEEGFKTEAYNDDDFYGHIVLNMEKGKPSLRVWSNGRDMEQRQYALPHEATVLINKNTLNDLRNNIDKMLAYLESQ